MIDKNYLVSAAKECGLEIDSVTAQKFDTYAEMLVEFNKSINLTSITEPFDIVTKHFLDCISPTVMLNIPQFAKIIDVGTGAGFPGIPLKLVREDLNLTLLDSLDKRLKVLKSITAEIGISAEFVHSRAEEASRQKAHREKYDIAVSRAVARLDKLCEYCLPYVKVGGMFYAFKGPLAKEELYEAENAIKLLGGQCEEIIQYPIFGTDLTHCIVAVKKRSATPAKYPRQSAKIAQKPL